MKLKYIPTHVPISQEAKNYLLVLNALKKSRDKIEKIKALKEGLNKPLKKWTSQEIEACYFGKAK